MLSPYEVRCYFNFPVFWLPGLRMFSIKPVGALLRLFYPGIQPSSWILALQVKILFGLLRFEQKFAKEILGWESDIGSVEGQQIVFPASAPRPDLAFCDRLPSSNRKVRLLVASTSSNVK